MADAFGIYDANKALDELKSKLDGFNRRPVGGGGTTGSLRSGVGRVRAEPGPFDGIDGGVDLDRLGQNLDRARDLWSGYGDSVSRALMKIVSDGKITTQDFADFASSILLEMSQRIMRDALDPLADAIEETFRSLWKGAGTGGTGGSGGGLFSWLKDAIAGFFGGWHADGGTIPAGTWGIVGERGPEPVYAGPTPLQVVPHEVAFGRQGESREAAPVTVHMTVVAQDARSFRASEGQIAAGLVAAISRGQRNQ